MQSEKLSLKDFLFIVPASLILGAGLASLQTGAWWIGWLGFSALFIVGLIALVIASCGERTRFDAWCAPYGGNPVCILLGMCTEIANNHKSVLDQMEQSSGLDDTRTSRRYRSRFIPMN